MNRINIFVRVICISIFILTVSNLNLFAQVDHLIPDEINFVKSESKVRYDLVVKEYLFPVDYESKYYEKIIIILPDKISETEKGFFLYSDNKDDDGEKFYLKLRTTAELYSRPPSETDSDIKINETEKIISKNLFEDISSIIEFETSNVKYGNYNSFNNKEGDKFIFLDTTLGNFKGGVLYESLSTERTQLLIDLVDELLMQMSGYVREVQRTAQMNKVIEELKRSY